MLIKLLAYHSVNIRATKIVAVMQKENNEILYMSLILKEAHSIIGSSAGRVYPMTLWALVITCEMRGLGLMLVLRTGLAVG